MSPQMQYCEFSAHKEIHTSHTHTQKLFLTSNINSSRCATVATVAMLDCLTNLIVREIQHGSCACKEVIATVITHGLAAPLLHLRVVV